jgi:hypothetical protein
MLTGGFGRKRNHVRLAATLFMVLAIGPGVVPAPLAYGAGAGGIAVPTDDATERSPANGEPVPIYTLQTPAGGLFETLSTTEARTAVTQYHFVRQPGSVAALTRTPFPGSRTLWRLRATTGSSYLITGSEQERDSLTQSGQFAVEGVLGYGAAAPGAGLVAIHRLSNNGRWSLAREADVPAQVAAGWHDDGILVYAQPEHLRAGAIYFGTWDAQSSMIIGATKQWYQRDGDWWGGVRDYASPQTTGDDAQSSLDYWKSQDPGHSDFSDREPQIGFYDDTDPHTLETQIDQASAAGLDYFSFYWYWDAVDHRQAITGGLDTFFQAANHTKIHPMLTLCASVPQAGNDLHIPVSDFGAVTDSLVAKYLSQPTYLRDNDGREVVQLCDHRGIGDAPDGSAEQTQQVLQFDQMLRDKTKQATGADLLILGNDNLMQSSTQGTNPLVAGLQLDGTACMGTFYGTGAQSYQDNITRNAADMAVAPATFGRCGQTDFDERPRYPILYAPGTQSQIRYYTDSSPQLYGEELDNVHNDITRSVHLSPIDNFVWLYAWNEWHEGGHLEPDARDGDALLQVTTQHLDLGS